MYCNCKLFSPLLNLLVAESKQQSHEKGVPENWNSARILNLSLRVPPLLFSSCFGLQDTRLGHGPIFTSLPMKIFSNEPVLPILAHFGHFTGSPLGGGQVCRRIFKFSLNGCTVHGRMVLSQYDCLGLGYMCMEQWGPRKKLPTDVHAVLAQLHVNPN